MERKIMNNLKKNNLVDITGDPAISEMEYYSTMPEDENKSKADDSAKVKDMFKLFMGIVDQLKEYEELDKLNTTENRCSEDCT